MAQHEWDDGVGKPTVRQRDGSLILGLPLLVILVSFAVFLRQRRTILFAGSLALIAFVLSQGSPLRIDGHNTSIPLPFAVLTNHPIIGGLIPVRFALYTALFAAAMFAIGLDELWRRMRRSGRPAWLSPRWRTVASVGSVGSTRGRRSPAVGTTSHTADVPDECSVFLHVGGRKVHSIRERGPCLSLPGLLRWRVFLRALRHHARPGRYRHALQVDRRLRVVPVVGQHHEHSQSLRPETRICSGHLRCRVPRRRHGRNGATLKEQRHGSSCVSS